LLYFIVFVFDRHHLIVVPLTWC